MRKSPSGRNEHRSIYQNILFPYFSFQKTRKTRCQIGKSSSPTHRTFNDYWLQANEALKSRLVYESSTDAAVAPKDAPSAYQHLAVLYVKYIQIFKKLEVAYDQMVHPQKRRLLKEVVVSVMGRMLELRHVFSH